MQIKLKNKYITKKLLVVRIYDENENKQFFSGKLLEISKWEEHYRINGSPIGNNKNKIVATFKDASVSEPLMTNLFIPLSPYNTLYMPRIQRIINIHNIEHIICNKIINKQKELKKILSNYF